MPAEQETWPVEAEVADSELTRMTVAAGVLGVLFLAIAAWIGYTMYITPRFPWEGLPLVPLVIFGLGGAVDLALAATTRGAVKQLWRKGNFAASRERLGGVSLALGFIVGGIVPGIFLGRARSGLAPLAELKGPEAAPLTESPHPSPAAAPRNAPAPSAASHAPSGGPCPKCGNPRPSADSKFCNKCGAAF